MIPGTRSTEAASVSLTRYAITAIPAQEHRSPFIDPKRLIGIVLFCADARIGCSDYCLRNFPLAIASRVAT
jgi:hypothetical protein